MAKPHGIRKHGKVDTYYVKVECDKCGDREVLACYEDELAKRSFNLGFAECPNCLRVICGDCEAQLEKDYCPICGNVSLRKLTPLEVYRCNKCFTDDEKNLCDTCRYPHVNKKKD